MNIKNNSKQSKKLPSTQFFFIILSIGFVLANIPVFMLETNRITNYNKVITHNVVGYQFVGMEKFIPKGTKFVSYFTDGNLKNPRRYKLFQKAQYVLAPAILDPDNLNHEYVLFVCDNPMTALKIIRDKNLQPLQLNSKHGILLAKRR